MGKKLLYDMRNSPESKNHKEKAQQKFKKEKRESYLWVAFGLIFPLLFIPLLANFTFEELIALFILLPVGCIVWAIFSYRFEKRVMIGEMGEYIISEKEIIYLAMDGEDISRYLVESIIRVYTEPDGKIRKWGYISLLRWNKEKQIVVWSFIHKDLVFDKELFFDVLKGLGLEIIDGHLERSQYDIWRNMDRKHLVD